MISLILLPTPAIAADDDEEVLEEALPFLIIKGNESAYTISRVASHDVIVGLSLCKL